MNRLIKPELYIWHGWHRRPACPVRPLAGRNVKDVGTGKRRAEKFAHFAHSERRDGGTGFQPALGRARVRKKLPPQGKTGRMPVPRTRRALLAFLCCFAMLT